MTDTKVDPEIMCWLSSEDRKAYQEDTAYWNARFKLVSNAADEDPTEDYEEMYFIVGGN